MKTKNNLLSLAVILIAALFLSVSAGAQTYQRNQQTQEKTVVRCKMCNGTGKCYKCRGTGKESCKLCFGGGKVMGSGTTEKGTPTIVMVECTTCNGTGKVDCTSCSGSGVCGVCNGAGTFEK